MTPAPTIARGPDVAIGVSRADTDEPLFSDFLQRLRIRLSPRRDYTFDVWDSSLLPIGVRGGWRREVLRELDKRPYSMPLLSYEYLASDFIKTEEWPRAARAIMFPVGLGTIDLDPDVLSPPVAIEQIFTFNHKFFDHMRGNQAKNDFVNAFVKAMIDRLKREVRPTLVSTPSPARPTCPQPA
ncbi:MAG: hypothetical protein LBK72_10330 [Bifidobacteriaceae bacterium]|jgi:hypothetical protein|nr:hypothetical protein [Bifidobacteriaceae bacterium]